MRTATAGTAGRVRSTTDSTTPKLPPPAPRSAQNRSGYSSADAVTIRPEASSTRAESRWSAPRP